MLCSAVHGQFNFILQMVICSSHQFMYDLQSNPLNSFYIVEFFPRSFWVLQFEMLLKLIQIWVLFQFFFFCYLFEDYILPFLLLFH
jgi:hypothetical protein